MPATRRSETVQVCPSVRPKFKRSLAQLEGQFGPRAAAITSDGTRVVAQSTARVRRRTSDTDERTPRTRLDTRIGSSLWPGRDNSRQSTRKVTRGREHS